MSAAVESRLRELTCETRTRVRVRTSGFVGWIRGELPATGMVTIHHSQWCQTQCHVEDVEPIN